MRWQKHNRTSNISTNELYVFYIHNTKLHNNPKIPSSAETKQPFKETTPAIIQEYFLLQATNFVNRMGTNVTVSWNLIRQLYNAVHLKRHCLFHINFFHQKM